jgi:hypothetical protein
VIGNYTKDDILQSALRYNNQRDWQKNEPTLFKLAINYRYRKDSQFWNDCVSHMEYIFKPNGYWTYEKCAEVASRYTDKSTFRKEENLVFKAIYRNKWFDLICNMVSLSKSGRVVRYREEFDTIKKCKTEALNYKTRSELSIECPILYKIILKNDWSNVCFSHMKKLINIKKRFIYVFEFKETNHAYVGLTCNIERRKNAHLGLETQYGKVKSNVYKHMIEHNIQPVFKIITKRPVKEENAENAENKWIKYYKDNGWLMLNIAKAGSLGSRRRRTIDYYLDIKNKCTTLSEFMKKISPHDRHTLKGDGLWDELIDGLNVDFNIWTKDKVYQESHNYKGWLRSKLQKEASGYYKALLRYNLMDDLFPIKEELSYEECKEIALKYDIYREFRNKEKKVWSKCRVNKWVELTQHMKKNVRLNGTLSSKPVKSKYTLEICKELSKDCETISEFGKRYSGAYKFIYKNNLMHELFTKRERVFESKYTYEICEELSMNCKKRSDFQKNYSGAYKYLKKNSLLDKLYPKDKREFKSKYTYEICEELSKDFPKRKDFQKKHSGAYKFLKRNNLLDKLYSY